MSTEIPPTEPTAPVDSAPKSGTVKPDNQHQDIIGTDEAPAEDVTAAAPVKAKSTTSGAVKPDNQHQDSEPTG